MNAPLPNLPSAWWAAFGRPVWNELRAPVEKAELRRTPVALAPGAGRPVVVVTGYMATPASASALTSWLGEADYDVRVAAVGRNALASEPAVERIGDALEEAGEGCVLIGHSRGGQQCRVAAMRYSKRVEQLITLGAPVRTHVPRQAVLRTIVEGWRVAGRVGIGPAADLDAENRYAAQLAAPFDVEVSWTSIWSKSDGIVEWQACLDEAARSVEVGTSHTGLLASAESFGAIAEVLAELDND